MTPDPQTRAAWLAEMSRQDELEDSALTGVNAWYWEAVQPEHQAFVERFLERLPHGGAVLDAACGPGRYFDLVLVSGRSVLGVDHSEIYLAAAKDRHPEVKTERHKLAALPYRAQFDGVMCVDAMEMVPPEEWPLVVERFRQALRPGGWLYLTVELVPPEEISELNKRLLDQALPAVAGEVIWEPEGYYHYYPPLDQVRAWLGDAGFEIIEDVEGPWHEQGYAYHHLLARLTVPG
jgi:SAM-dependent methyltransferase